MPSYTKKLHRAGLVRAKGISFTPFCKHCSPSHRGPPTLLRLVPAHNDPIGGLCPTRLPHRRQARSKTIPVSQPSWAADLRIRQPRLSFGPLPLQGLVTLTFIEKGLLTHRYSTPGSHMSGPEGVPWMTVRSSIVHPEISYS